MKDRDRLAVEAERQASFEEFVTTVEPTLHRVCRARFGRERGREATAEALAFAWERWDFVQKLDNPVAYLFTVGRSRTRARARKQGQFTISEPATEGAPRDFEPGLEAALARLSTRQRTAVLLVVGCEWSYAEVGKYLGIRRATVQKHVDRALARLRHSLGDADS